MSSFYLWGSEISLEGKESSLGPQVRFILILQAGVVTNCEYRPSGKNGSGIFAYERPHSYPGFTGSRVLPPADGFINIYLA